MKIKEKWKKTYGWDITKLGFKNKMLRRKMKKETKKKKNKRKIQIKQGKDIIESIENTKLGNAVNHEELKRLIGSEPH